MEAWEKSLKEIKRVEAPPFLFTRIEAKISSLHTEKLPLKWAYVASIAACLLIYFNIWSLSTYIKTSPSESQEVYQEFSFMNTTNQIYYDQD